MNGQEYLNQISAKNRPEKKTDSGGLLSSKFFLVGVIGVVALVLIIILGAVLGSGKGNEKELGIALKMHLNETLSIISEYQYNIRSSSLRADSASLNTVLNNTNKELGDYLTEVHGFEERNVGEKVLEEAKLQSDAIREELFVAKINGNLDRIYAIKMTYEISLFLSEEGKILKTTKNDQLEDILSTSYNSLTILYDKFNDFSGDN